jgi:formylmethanofuran dehydrogenase subunit E
MPPSLLLPDSQSKCHVCQRVVYAVEFVGASDKAFHKACFRCEVCHGQLRADTFATVDGRFFCKPHYEQAFKVAGNYSSGFAKQ